MLEERRGFVVQRPVIHASASGRVREDAAAKYLGCSARQLRRMRARDEGPSYDLVCGRVWYRLSALDEYLGHCERQTHR